MAAELEEYLDSTFVFLVVDDFTRRHFRPATSLISSLDFARLLLSLKCVSSFAELVSVVTNDGRNIVVRCVHERDFMRCCHEPKRASSFLFGVLPVE